MRVFLAGATGAIGVPLVERLLRDGHAVVATSRSAERAKGLEAKGVKAVVLDAFDAAAVREAIGASKPEIVIHQLTSLPQDVTPRAMRKAGEATAKLRRETVPVFIEAARDAGARRILVQSISFITPPSGPRIHDETAPLWLDCPDADFREGILACRDMEAAITGASGIEALSLRYGFFYGPGTWYAPKGTMGVQLMRRFLPVIGDGEGLASFIHIDDAVDATVRAMTAGNPGIYNVTDDEPATWREWVTEAASLLGAKSPRRLPAWLVKLVGGRIPVHYATTLRAASNEKAKSGFGLVTRPWREGFREVFGSQSS